MDIEIETHHHEAETPGHVVSKVADAVPAFGIVVAVMGVVNVMGSVGEPPAVLGKMIGGALVGTFLGILIAYGFVSPVASLLEQKAQDGAKHLSGDQGRPPRVDVRLCAASGRRVRAQGAGFQPPAEFSRARGRAEESQGQVGLVAASERGI
jgi:hypothetical protein